MCIYIQLYNYIYNLETMCVYVHIYTHIHTLAELIRKKDNISIIVTNSKISINF